MAWTLALLLVVGSIVLVTYLHRTIQKIRKNAFVYPSEAVIDQILPPEVFEQIFLNGDYSTNLACSLVSKYWHHHATKDQIQQHVYRNDTLLLSLNENELKADFAEHAKVKYDTIKWTWLQYPDNYPQKWRLEDELFAKRLGKTLIATAFDNARSVYYMMQNASGREKKIDDKYLIKLRGQLQYQYLNKWTLKDTLSDSNFHIEMAKIPDADKYPFTRHMECEVLVDLKSVSMDLVTDGVRRLRLLDDRTYIAGFPLSAILVQIGFILLLPCLIVDYRNSPASEAKFNATAIVMALFEVIFVLIAIGGQVQETSNAPHLTVARKRNIAAVLTIIVATISIIFYRWAFEMTNYVTMLAGCSLYFIIVEDVMKSNYRTGKLVAFIGCCLVVSMNDWKLTVDAFKNAKIFWTFLFNCGVHIQLGVLISLQNLLFKYFKDGKLVWQDLWRWRTLAYEIYLIQLFTLVFITLYAPTTTYKIFDEE
jgi:hypothetical protein